MRIPMCFLRFTAGFTNAYPLCFPMLPENTSKVLHVSRRIDTQITTYCAGPLTQATGPPQFDAGVGIGILIGLGDAWKSLKFKKWAFHKYQESTRNKKSKSDVP